MVASRRAFPIGLPLAITRTDSPSHLRCTARVDERVSSFFWLLLSMPITRTLSWTNGSGQHITRCDLQL